MPSVAVGLSGNAAGRSKLLVPWTTVLVKLGCECHHQKKAEQKTLHTRKAHVLSWMLEVGTAHQ